MRLIFLWMIIVGFVGIGICDLWVGRWKLAAAGLSLAMVQWLIFGG